MRVIYSYFFAMIVLAITGFIPFREADAAFTITVETVAAASPGAGWLDITLLNESGDSVEISTFTLGIAISGSDVVFSGVSPGPTGEYIFGNEGTGELALPDEFPTTDFIAGDTSLNGDGFVTLGNGDLVRLARVSFTVGQFALLGLRPVTIDPAFTSFVDFDGNFVIDASNITFAPGGVDVLLQQSELVPEPTSAALLLSGMSILFGRRRRRLV